MFRCFYLHLSNDMSIKRKIIIILNKKLEERQNILMIRVYLRNASGLLGSILFIAQFFGVIFVHVDNFFVNYFYAIYNND